MCKDNFFDDLYKLMDPLGDFDLNKDGHYNRDERFLVEEEREMQETLERSHGKTMTDFGDDDFGDDDF